MVFLRSPFTPDLPPVLRGDSVTLRTPDVGDHKSWAELRLLSRAFLAPWEPEWPANDLTRAAFRARVKRYWRDIAEDAAYPFFIFSADGRTLLGALTLSNVRRGVAQMATLGYWTGLPHLRRGYMTAAVRLILPFAFDHLRLHRVEASCLPGNTASIALLRRTGFAEEGLARNYLKINGVWRDHLLFARLADGG
ncbi:MAG: GNAT family N-acetyltransferase [Rhizobiales bacterium]|nr:GNAT family N-acetyltransferase [Hyphomicrobiales bacterium]MBI3673604.1 GNAT family N-acetyltransferase [Hyphomicrobiales bacterium]